MLKIESLLTVAERQAFFQKAIVSLMNRFGLNPNEVYEALNDLNLKQKGYEDDF